LLVKAFAMWRAKIMRDERPIMFWQRGKLLPDGGNWLVMPIAKMLFGKRRFGDFRCWR
jgi:hypothetical protein